MEEETPVFSSNKWVKVEGKLTSAFIDLERLKEIQERKFDTIARLLEESGSTSSSRLEGTSSLEVLESIDVKELEVPFIFDSSLGLFGKRFEDRFYYIHSKEKTNFFQFFSNFNEPNWMYFVGPKGF